MTLTADLKKLGAHEHKPGFDAAADDQMRRDIAAAKVPERALAKAYAAIEAALDAGGRINDSLTRAERDYFNAVRTDPRFQFVVVQAYLR